MSKKSIAVIGLSGSGRSTFLTIAEMLLLPDEGSGAINGKNLSRDKKKNWARIRKCIV